MKTCRYRFETQASPAPACAAIALPIASWIAGKAAIGTNILHTAIFSSSLQCAIISGRVPISDVNTFWIWTRAKSQQNCSMAGAGSMYGISGDTAGAGGSRNGRVNLVMAGIASAGRLTAPARMAWRVVVVPLEMIACSLCIEAAARRNAGQFFVIGGFGHDALFPQRILARPSWDAFKQRMDLVHWPCSAVQSSA